MSANPTRSAEVVEPRAVCGAKTRSGGECQAFPVAGATRCRMHGGSAPQVRRKAAERLEQQALARQIGTWGGRLDISAPEALLELVQAKAAEVAYWNAKVDALADGERAGLLLTKRKTGGDDYGDTREAAAHIYLTLLHKAQDQLAQYAAAAVRAGLDEALVRLHTLQGGLLLEVARRVLAVARSEQGASDDDVIRLALTQMGETR